VASYLLFFTSFQLPWILLLLVGSTRPLLVVQVGRGCSLDFQAKSTLWKIPVLAQQHLDVPMGIWCLWFEPVIPLGT